MRDPGGSGGIVEEFPRYLSESVARRQSYHLLEAGGFQLVHRLRRLLLRVRRDPLQQLSQLGVSVLGAVHLVVRNLSFTRRWGTEISLRKKCLRPDILMLCSCDK